MTKHATRTSASRASRRAPPALVPPVPIVEPPDDLDLASDQPFVEGAQDTLDPDLRHRLVSEAAYRRYADRGYDDGYDVEDWLQAEADVDHLLLGRRPGSDDA